MSSRLPAPSEPGKSRVRSHPDRDVRERKPASSSGDTTLAGEAWKTPSPSWDFASPYGLQPEPEERS